MSGLGFRAQLRTSPHCVRSRCAVSTVVVTGLIDFPEKNKPVILEQFLPGNPGLSESSSYSASPSGAK